METAESFLKVIEKNEKTWYISPIFGHSLSAGMPLLKKKGKD
jgi:hypothetical protein